MDDFGCSDLLTRDYLDERAERIVRVLTWRMVVIAAGWAIVCCVWAFSFAALM